LKYQIAAHPDCIALESSWENILGNLNGADHNGSSMNIYKRINKLKKIYIFKHFSEPKLISLSTILVKEKFNVGEYIFKEGEQGDKFYLILTGRVQIRKNGQMIRDLEAGSSFGEVALIRQENRSATVCAIEETNCYTLAKDQFLKMVDKNVQDYISKKISLQDTSIQLKDLYNIKFLGMGKFGKVNLVHNHKTVYAIKAVSRAAAEKRKILTKYFQLERRILLTLDHPFIIKLVKTLRNQNYCFFLMEYVNGVNMDDYLGAKNNQRNIYETKFYAGTIIIVLEYLHNKNIAHRDLKPANIMIDSNGYLKVIDFGTSKVITDFTNTIIGTPHYIAPEILYGKGYSLSSDIWSLGICLYEIFYGCYPFGDSAFDILEVYKDVLHK
jgi:cGMP-dependent protein kinase